MNENKALAVASPAALISASWEQKTDLIRAMYPGAKPAELEMFFHQAKRMGLDPLARQIHLVTRKKGNSGETMAVVQVGIDGYRAVADRTQLYAGNDDPLFDEGLTQYQMIQAGKLRPETSTVTVYKVVGGVRCPFTATATWKAYCPTAGNDFMWVKMPYLMLSKCAEALALRKAFPAELSGVYTDEEMDQAGKVITVTLDTPVQHQASLAAPVAQQAQKAPQAAAKPAQSATPAPAPAAKPDVLNENAIDDFALVMAECKTPQEAEHHHNKFANSVSCKGSPKTVEAAYDSYQKTLDRLKQEAGGGK